jgi:hypothetical protein
LEQARLAAAKAERRRRAWIVVGSGVAVVALGAGVAVAALVGRHPAKHAAGPALPTVEALAASGGARPLPWATPPDASAAIRAAGLTPLAGEGTADHYHAHLDVIVNGTAVSVPAGIGIDEQGQRISALHVHDESGVVHIESPTAGTPYYLGQLFREWNVALSQTQVGGFHADATHALTAYIDGKPVAGNPADIKLAAHQEIALVYGPTGQQAAVPSGYVFGDL